MDLWPQFYSPVTAGSASFAKPWLLASVGVQTRSAAQPTIISAINVVELEESAVPAIATHLPTSLTLAVNIAIAVSPQPVPAETRTLWHSPAVGCILTQK